MPRPNSPSRPASDEAPSPIGPGVRLPERSGKLGGAVPVRFQPATIAQIKEFAESDGLSVSSWIRQVVEAELRSRQAQSDRMAPVIASVIFLSHVRGTSNDVVAAFHRKAVHA